MVVAEQGVEYRSGNEVLRQHFDDFVIGDAAVEIVPQFFRQLGEGLFFPGVGRVFQYAPDAVDVGLGDFGDVFGPFFPVMAIADFFDEFGIDGAFDFPDLEFELSLLR